MKFDNKSVPTEKYYERSSRVFVRLIKQCDVENEDAVEFIILNKMLRYSKSLHCVDQKQDPMERKKVLKIVLDFMQTAKEKGTLIKFLNPEKLFYKDDYADILHLLICQDGYKENLKQYLEIFASVYSNNDQVLCSLLREFDRFQNNFWATTIGLRFHVGKLEGKIYTVSERK